MQVATQQITNTAKLKDVRRGIARVRTLQARATAEKAPAAKGKQGARA
jgi:ribosomal protein L29